MVFCLDESDHLEHDQLGVRLVLMRFHKGVFEVLELVFQQLPTILLSKDSL